MPIAPGTLFVVDEGSMVSMGHIARIIDLAERHGCKVFVTGDHQQLTAVEAGGAMTLLANHLGHTQLAVPVRPARTAAATGRQPAVGEHRPQVPQAARTYPQ